MDREHNYSNEYNQLKTCLDLIKQEQQSLQKPVPSKGNPLFVDPKLPPGWRRSIKQRQFCASAGKYDVYLYAPDGTKFRSTPDVATYLRNKDMKLDARSFDFTVFGDPSKPNMSDGVIGDLSSNSGDLRKADEFSQPSSLSGSEPAASTQSVVQPVKVILPKPKKPKVPKKPKSPEDETVSKAPQKEKYSFKQLIINFGWTFHPSPDNPYATFTIDKPKKTLKRKKKTSVKSSPTKKSKE